ncbi:MAG TPA: cohesin domain-containing protein [Bacteroidales bacterium]|nr:cohesin domain-containing protein [Bacteroidales bacterium]
MKQIFTKTCMLAGMMVSMQISAQQGLFISELADPADDYHGRFVELYNAGNNEIVLSNTIICLSRQSNGGTSWGDVQLTGSILPGETYVIGTSYFSAFYGFTPDLETGILIGNGDDAYCLFTGGDHETGELLDIYGAMNTDGTGEPWEYTDSRAVRNQDATSPSLIWAAADWSIASANLADFDPGTHHGNGGGDIPVPGDYTLSVENDTVNPGETVNLPVHVSPLINSDGIISFQFSLTYDPSAILYSGYQLDQTLGEGGTIEVNDINPGSLNVSCIYTEPLSGEGDIIILQFDALQMDTTAVTISDAYLNNTVVSNLNDGEVYVVENTPPHGYLVFSDTAYRFADSLEVTAVFTEPLDQSSQVLLSLTGAVEETDLVMHRQNDTVYNLKHFVPASGGTVTASFSGGLDLFGNVLFPMPDSGATFSIIHFLPGDVDDDGSILAYDAALTLQHSVGLDPLPVQDPLPWQPWRDSTANVDRNENITAFDAALILQHSAGIINSFSGGVKKTVSEANIFIENIEGEMVIYAEGGLSGLNINLTEGAEYIGQPVFLDDDFIHASKTTDGTYSIGIATAYPVSELTPVIKIPVNKEGMIRMECIVNQSLQRKSVSAKTGLTSFINPGFNVYPNPANEILYIEMDGAFTQKGYEVILYSMTGDQMRRFKTTRNDFSIDLQHVASKGMCVLQLIDIEHGSSSVQPVLIE